MAMAIMPGCHLHLNLIAGARAGSLPSLPPRGCPHALQWHLPGFRHHHHHHHHHHLPPRGCPHALQWHLTGFHHHRHIFQCEHIVITNVILQIHDA